MARPLRIEFPGAVYHVTSRGNARADIFETTTTASCSSSARPGRATRHWLCHAYCLMDNHYHLLVETPEGNLSAGMRQLNGVYTQAFNRTHDGTAMCSRDASRRSWSKRRVTCSSSAATSS